MAKVQCPKCKATFKGSPLKGPALAIAGASIGAYYGSSIGIAGGIIGAMAGTVPGAIGGGLLGYLSSNKFYKCEKCGKYFML